MNNFASKKLNILNRFYLNHKRAIQGFVLIFVIMVAFMLRVYNYSWDQGFHLHPDERYMTMVVNEIKIPKSVAEYFNAEESLFSPYNVNFDSYVYGTLPVHFVKVFTSWFGYDNYSDSLFIGRVISATFDLGSLLLLYILSRYMTKSFGLRLLAVVLYGFAVLPIQMSHFYAVDTFLNFFMVWNLLVITQYLQDKRHSYLWNGIFIGLLALSSAFAIASKITGIFSLILSIVAICFRNVSSFSIKYWYWRILKILTDLILFFLVGYLVLRLFYPYLFASSNFFDYSISSQFLNILDFIARAQNGEFMYPPQWQWLHTQAYLFPLTNTIVWQFGLLTGLIVMFSVLGMIIILIKKFLSRPWISNFRNYFLLNPVFIYLGFVIVYFAYYAAKFAKAGRYFVVIYVPAILIAIWVLNRLMQGKTIHNLIGKFGLNKLFQKLLGQGRSDQKLLQLLIIIMILFQFVWAMAYMSIYFKLNTRISASQWIYQNIPEGTNVTYELWDDPLPLQLAPLKNYNILETHVFNPDDEKKISELYEIIKNADYVILSSGRAKYTIGKLINEFPYMVNYYKLLDSGELGYKLVYKAYSYPTFLGLEFNDETAEEPFWVYDHPTVWIYKREKETSYAEFEALLKFGNANSYIEESN